MNSLADQQLLYDYAAHQSDAAFAELVRRHIDLVYSAALRMVGDTHLAEDVTQSAFVALAQNARQLTGRAVLSGWLHRTAQNLAANAVRSEVRRRAREQEAAVMNELLSAESDATWETIAPHLDAALGELNDAERDALLLRYFERKSAREMAAILGTSEDAAQKRVSRAMERLREFFSKRNVTVGASGLAVLISANAVQSAPIGLAATISAAAVLAGTVVSTSTAIAATKTIAMTTLQKTIVGAALIAVVGTGVFEAHQASQLRDQVQTLQQQQAPLAEQIQELQRERDDATNQLAGLLAENSRLKSNSKGTELLKLRGEVTTLRTDRTKNSNQQNLFADMAKSFATNDFMKTAMKNAMASSIEKTYAKLIADLHLTPDQASALKQLLIDKRTTAMDMSAGMDMLSGKMTAAQIKQLGDQIKAAKTKLPIIISPMPATAITIICLGNDVRLSRKITAPAPPSTLTRNSID